MLQYADVLEQFNMEFFHVEMLRNSFFLLVFLLLSSLVFYDIWISLFVLTNFFIIISFNFNTSNFIQFILFWILLFFIFEIVGPFIEISYFVIAIISDFILAKTQSHLGGKLEVYYIFLVGTSIFLGVFNLLGIIPFTMVLTGHFIFAFYFSTMFFIVNLLYGILYHKVELFNLFLSGGIPLFIIPGLIIIEAISFFSRVLSLAIRLFANLVAGHILLKILISFLYVIYCAHTSFGLPTIVALIGILIIIALEVMISILQVYIFILLLIIYINSVLNLH
jgi:ATP synthase subunit 6